MKDIATSLFSYMERVYTQLNQPKAKAGISQSPFPSYVLARRYRVEKAGARGEVICGPL